MTDPSEPQARPEAQTTSSTNIAGAIDKLRLTLRHELLREDRRALWRADLESSKAFDRAILTLAAAGFGLSIALGRELRWPSSCQITFLVYVTWGAFLASMGTILISFRTSQVACRKMIDDYENELFGKEKHPREANTASVATGVLNWLSATFLILGAVLLAVVASVNWKEFEMADGPKWERLEKGYVPKVPRRPDDYEKHGYVPPPPRKEEPPPPPPPRDEKK